MLGKRCHPAQQVLLLVFLYFIPAPMDSIQSLLLPGHDLNGRPWQAIAGRRPLACRHWQTMGKLQWGSCMSGGSEWPELSMCQFEPHLQGYTRNVTSASPLFYPTPVPCPAARNHAKSESLN